VKIPITHGKLKFTLDTEYYTHDGWHVKMSGAYGYDPDECNINAVGIGFTLDSALQNFVEAFHKPAEFSDDDLEPPNAT
jgi:hypothetical protein